MLNTKADRICIQKVELGTLINKDTIKEEINSDAELDKIDNNSGDENPYRESIVNNMHGIENTLSQMEQWLILSNVINYVQYSKAPKNYHDMMIKPININYRINKKTKNENIDEFSLVVDL